MVYSSDEIDSTCYILSVSSTKYGIHYTFFASFKKYPAFLMDKLKNAKFFITNVH